MHNEVSTIAASSSLFKEEKWFFELFTHSIYAHLLSKMNWCYFPLPGRSFERGTRANSSVYKKIKNYLIAVLKQPMGNFFLVKQF